MSETTGSSSRGSAERPLSPHLQIWKWHVTMATSISHRMTGVGNAVGALLLVWWLLALAGGPESYAVFQGFISHWFGQLVLFGFTVSISYHLLNGIRHLFWDAGLGFELGTSRATGLLVYLGTIVLAVGIWVLGYMMKGSL